MNAIIKNKKIIIVGAGFAGATIARELAEAGYQVLVLEKREHVSGNMYDEKDNHGFLIQKYGPHILFTDSVEVVDYLSRFSELVRHDCKMLSFIDGKYVQLPFNFTSILELIGNRQGKIVIDKLRKQYPFESRVSIYELMTCSDRDISDYAKLLYAKAFETYISKMWNLPPQKISKDVINRVKICMGFDGRYLNRDFQFLPSNGFFELITNMLTHPNIRVQTNFDALKHISFSKGKCLFDGDPEVLIVFTGPIDELASERFGRLPYRSLLFDISYFNQIRALPEEIVSLPQDPKLIRKTEYKYFNIFKGDFSEHKTVVVSETPVDYGPSTVPCYPVINDENVAKYQLYKNEMSQYSNLILCGRLAEYKYYNMDQVILHALDVSKQLLS